MKRTLILSLFISLVILNSYADDAPICVTHGGNVKPIENTDIQMYSETIDIILKPTHYEVEVNYVFKNHGDEQNVTMGFPSSTRSDMSFKAYDGETELKITKMKSDWDFKPQSGMSCQYISNPIDQFECHSVVFKAGETKYIKNTYKQRYDPAYREGPNTSFYYIITTGAYWKDDITSIEVRINTEDAPINFDLDNAFLNKEKTSIKNYYRKFENIEPKDDLYFGIKYKDEYIPQTKAPVLEPSGSINYNVRNLCDGNLNTAWVEGSPDSGIGNVIRFYNPCRKAYKVKSLSLINGYAKNESTFKENNRVSCIKVTITHNYAPNSSPILDGGYYCGINEYYNGKVISEITYVFTLKDTSEKQEIIFDYPIPTSWLTVEILDIHKGTKYDDTAITELKLNYTKETTNR